MANSIPFTHDGVTYQLVKCPSGWDIYLRGNWIAWTAGTITDARNTAKDMVKKDAPGAQES